jgi:hypothetical protein
VGAGAFPIDEAVRWCKDEGVRFFVKTDGSLRELVVIEPKVGRPYLRTVRGGGKVNNLAALPDCPPP